MNIYYIFETTLNLFWSKVNNRFVERKELSKADAFELSEAKNFIIFKNNTEIKTIGQIFSRSIGDIVHPIVKIDGVQFYCDIPDLYQNIKNKRELTNMLKNYGGDDWSWILQSSAISFVFDITED